MLTGIDKARYAIERYQVAEAEAVGFRDAVQGFSAPHGMRTAGHYGGVAEGCGRGDGQFLPGMNQVRVSDAVERSQGIDVHAVALGDQTQGFARQDDMGGTQSTLRLNGKG